MEKYKEFLHSFMNKFGEQFIDVKDLRIKDLEETNQRLIEEIREKDNFIFALIHKLSEIVKPKDTIEL